jgi:hypothetical protein
LSRLRAAVAVSVLAATAVACGGGGGGPEVTVQLTDYEITANPIRVGAGEIDFAVRNDGGIAHELAVVRTDLAPAAVPTHLDGTADESAPGVRVVDRLQLGPAATGDLTVELRAGRYVLACNLAPDPAQGTPAHYSQRMYSAFEVTR